MTYRQRAELRAEFKRARDGLARAIKSGQRVNASAAARLLAKWAEMEEKAATKPHRLKLLPVELRAVFE